MTTVHCARCGGQMYSGEMHSCDITQMRYKIKSLENENARLLELHNMALRTEHREIERLRAEIERLRNEGA